MGTVCANKIAVLIIKIKDNHRDDIFSPNGFPNKKAVKTVKYIFFRLVAIYNWTPTYVNE